MIIVYTMVCCPAQRDCNRTLLSNRLLRHTQAKRPCSMQLHSSIKTRKWDDPSSLVYKQPPASSSTTSGCEWVVCAPR